MGRIFKRLVRGEEHRGDFLRRSKASFDGMIIIFDKQ
jgi:hypothetical protein